VRQVLDAVELERELTRVLGEPLHLRPALTLVLIQIAQPSAAQPSGGQTGATAPGRAVLALAASVAGERLRRSDTVGLVDDRTFAVLLTGASPAAADSVATDLEQLVQPLLDDGAAATEARAVAYGVSGATAGIASAALVAAARADLQRRSQRSTELSPR
jgi:GGDEF domain-containing protein